MGIGYSKATGGGFSRQITLEQPTSSESIIYQTCLSLFKTYYDDEPIRRVHISLTGLSKNEIYQFSIFEDANQILREHSLYSAMDEIKFKYGKNSVNRASSELESSTVKARNKMIGGHHA